MLREVWACIEALGSPASEIALATLAELAKAKGEGRLSCPLLEPCPLQARQLLRYRAVRGALRGGDPPESGIAAAMATIGKARVCYTARIADPEASTPPVVKGQLFDVVAMGCGGAGAGASGAWTVRGGQWAWWCADAAGRVLLCRVAGAALALRDRSNRALLLEIGLQRLSAGGAGEGVGNAAPRVAAAMGPIAPAHLSDVLRSLAAVRLLSPPTLADPDGAGESS